ncbi:hypothetical protein TWF696_009921 [Orbilia brochopaga]|uniref:Uncharacterized protein n=1 Tax=Orbilia brochopaga TaxID=3140254 RepID=A0AAV9U5H0_9PEZI
MFFLWFSLALIKGLSNYGWNAKVYCLENIKSLLKSPPYQDHGPDSSSVDPRLQEGLWFRDCHFKGFSVGFNLRTRNALRVRVMVVRCDVVSTSYSQEVSSSDSGVYLVRGSSGSQVSGYLGHSGFDAPYVVGGVFNDVHSFFDQKDVSDYTSAKLSSEFLSKKDLIYDQTFNCSSKFIDNSHPFRFYKYFQVGRRFVLSSDRSTFTGGGEVFTPVGEKSPTFRVFLFVHRSPQLLYSCRFRDEDFQESEEPGEDDMEGVQGQKDAETLDAVDLSNAFHIQSKKDLPFAYIAQVFTRLYWAERRAPSLDKSDPQLPDVLAEVATLKARVGELESRGKRTEFSSSSLTFAGVEVPGDVTPTGTRRRDVQSADFGATGSSFSSQTSEGEVYTSSQESPASTQESMAEVVKKFKKQGLSEAGFLDRFRGNQRYSQQQLTEFWRGTSASSSSSSSRRPRK